MKKSRTGMFLTMLLAAALTAGCSQKETQVETAAVAQGREGGEPSQEASVQPQERNMPEENEEASEDDPAEKNEEASEGDPAEKNEEASEGNPAEILPVQNGNAEHTLLSVYRTRHVYGGILSMLAAAYELPDIEIEKEALYDGRYSVSENRFAVADVDGDGREELLIFYTTSSMAGMFGTIYDYDPDTMELTRELLEFTDMRFYDNGTVIVSASHNHTYGTDFWPYTMYRYHAQTGQYEFAAFVSSWEKAYADVLSDGTKFPEELDADGDGVVYEIRTEQSWESEPLRYDGEDFNAWVSQQMNGASEIRIDDQPVSFEYFESYTADYLELMHDIAEKNTAVSQTDIGWLYIRLGSLEDAERYLSDHYAVKWETNPELEYVEEHLGSVGGNVIFWLVHMGDGILSYTDSRVEDVTVFGIYPGMDADEAVMTLMSYGFFPYDGLENYMITGDGVGNAAVSYQISDGVITGVSISAYCAYT